MTNLSDISDASRDPDLRDRLMSAAAEAGVPNPAAWVEENSRRLAAAPVDEAGSDTIAGVYAYAKASRPPAPGANPAAVLDSYIRHAVQAVNTPS